MKILMTTVMAAMMLTSFAGTAMAQGNPAPRYEGSVIGASFGFYTLTTWWYWYNSTASPGSREHYPIHVYSRKVISTYFEKRALFNLGKFSTAARGELLISLMGGSKEDWLPLGETISDGGMTYGFGGLMKFAYPTKLSENLPVAPYAGLGVLYLIVNSNGEGVGQQFAGDSDYDYASGWADFMFSVPMSLGVDFDLSKYVLTFEYRFNLFGSASTDWEPVGYAPDGTDIGVDALIFAVSLKL